MARALDDLDARLRLTPQEFGSFFILLVVAGNETTRNAISHGMMALTDFAEQRELLYGDFGAHAKTAIEEMVRWSTPVIHFRRTATEDTDINGFPIRFPDCPDAPSRHIYNQYVIRAVSPSQMRSPRVAGTEFAFGTRQSSMSPTQTAF